MPFPKSDRVEFERNPIKEVICQLKFPAVLRLKSEVPVAFQGAIGEDYPDYSDQHHDQDGNVIQIGINHFFRTKDSQRTLSLGTDFVALSEKSYSRWEIFAAEVQRAQQAVDEVYHPAYYNRVGLRYVDVIDRSDLGLDGVAWGEILNPSMLGFLGVPTIGEDIRQALSMTSISLGAELPGEWLQCVTDFLEVTRRIIATSSILIGSQG